MHKLPRHILLSTAAAVVAAFLYDSWPLGTLLNPQANKGLASNLEAAHQPFNWLFIGFDIISGLLIFAVAVNLLYRFRLRSGRVLKTALFGYGVFGLLTVLDAVLPLDCVPTIRTCPSPLDDPSYILHGIGSIGSVTGLAISVAAFWWLYKATPTFRWLLWPVALIWLGFGMVTLLLIAHDTSSTTAQHIFITLCAAWMVIVPWLSWRLVRLSEKVGSV